MLDGKKIVVSFGEQKVLQSVSIKLQKGERIALFGTSGAGKTTLLKVLSGLYNPNAGEICFNGIKPQFQYINSSSVERKWIWPKVTLVFQDIQLFPNLSGFENCSDNLQNQSLEKSNEVWELATHLDVLHIMNKSPKKMSQGEQQRIAIIRALLKNPDFLLLDEPTSALDPIIKKQLGKILVEKSESKGMGFLIATHDWEFANQFTQKFIVVKNGELKFFETITGATNEMSGIQGK